MDVPLTDLVLLYVVLLISLVFHEAAHALLALWGGDRTAYVGGQVTLNPLPHIRREPFGMVYLPVIMLAMSTLASNYGYNPYGPMCLGFASTPISAAWARRHPKRASLMSLAGPTSNFLLAAIAVGILKLLVVNGAADPWMERDGTIPLLVDPIENTGMAFATAKICTVFVILNVVLGVLNLIPWPPLDGASVLEGLFPRQLRPFYDSIRTRPVFLIIGIVVLWRFLPSMYVPVLTWFQSLLRS